MRHVQSSAAKTHLLKLLDDVERGETIVITRHGRSIARIVPEQDHRGREIEKALHGLEALRESLPKTGMTIDDILAMRHEGHRY